MKKIKVMLIIILIISIGLISNMYMSKQRLISKTATSVTAKADIAFAVLGDIHNDIIHFQLAINDLYRINPKMDALVLNGDIVDQGINRQYNLIKRTLSKNKDLLPETIIKNIGNHEFFQYSTEVNSPQQVKTFINRYLQFSGEEKVYHDTWVNNYHFISLGSEDGNSETTNSVTAFISKDQQNWLKEKLGENYQKGKPIFVFLHQNLNRGSFGWVGVKDSEQIRQILSQYPEVILFTSHTHKDLNDSSVKLNQPFAMIETGAVHYTLVPDTNSENGRRQEPYIKGLYIEVNGNDVIVRGRNIKDKLWIFTREIHEISN